MVIDNSSNMSQFRYQLWFDLIESKHVCLTLDLVVLVDTIDSYVSAWIKWKGTPSEIG